MSELNIALAALSGIILFLFGLESFSKEMQRITGERFRKFLSTSTRNPWVGLGLGAIVTSLVQSSSATSVLTIGLVNSGLIHFKNSLGIIFGANIGTTFTAQLIAFNLTHFAPYIIILGFILSVARNKYSFLGKTIFYFGFVFFSLNLISQSVMPLQAHDGLLKYLTEPQGIFTSVMVGALFTAVVQSSSVTTGMAVIFTQSGLMSLDNAIPLVIGSNIGTTVKALFAMINMDKNAQRTAFSHLLFNLGGVLMFLPFMGVLQKLFTHNDPAVALANVHLLFNVVTSIIFTVFINPFSKMVLWVFPSHHEDVKPFEFPNIKDSTENHQEHTEEFIKKSFYKLFAQLRENYNLVTLSIESNYRNIFDRLKRKVIHYEMVQKDFVSFFADLINLTGNESQSQKIIVYLGEFEYLHQLHDSLKDIMSVKESMDERYIEMQSDMLLHFREVSTHTLQVFSLIDELIRHQKGLETCQDHLSLIHDLRDEFSELQQVINEFSKDLYRLMPNTKRLDIGTNLHFLTYSQRFKDKLHNLYKLIQ